MFACNGEGPARHCTEALILWKHEAEHVGGWGWGGGADERNGALLVTRGSKCQQIGTRVQCAAIFRFTYRPVEVVHTHTHTQLMIF